MTLAENQRSEGKPGIRLYPEDALAMVLKYGVTPEKAVSQPDKIQATFTITDFGHDKGAGKDYFRVLFHASKGLYVQTCYGDSQRRAQYHKPAPPVIGENSGYGRLSISRSIGETFVIRPYNESRQIASLADLQRNPVVIRLRRHTDFDIIVQICATQHWNIVRGELIGSQGMRDTERHLFNTQRLIEKLAKATPDQHPLLMEEFDKLMGECDRLTTALNPSDPAERKKYNRLMRNKMLLLEHCVNYLRKHQD